MKPIAFCFDLDGTVTQEEILPLIARKAEIYEEIKTLTQVTLKGMIPFENSFKLRVKLLSTIPISEVVKVVDKVKLDPNILGFIRMYKDNCYIITGNLDVWVKELIDKQLGCGCFSSTANYTGDKLIGINKILNKGDAIKELKKYYKEVITVGDSMNDCSMFEEGDLQIAYGGVHEPIETLIELSDYVVFNSRSLINLLALKV